MAWYMEYWRTCNHRIKHEFLDDRKILIVPQHHIFSNDCKRIEPTVSILFFLFPSISGPLDRFLFFRRNFYELYGRRFDL